MSYVEVRLVLTGTMLALKDLFVGRKFFQWLYLIALSSSDFGIYAKYGKFMIIDYLVS